MQTVGRDKREWGRGRGVEGLDKASGGEGSETADPIRFHFLSVDGMPT